MEVVLTFLHHSGFLIQTENCALVFDYWEDDCPGGTLSRLLETADIPIWFFVSHFHADHFNPCILDFKSTAPLNYIFGSDVKKRRSRQTAGHKISFLKEGDELLTPQFKVRACGSTDSGVSFMLQLGGRLIFHAGDLNNWHQGNQNEDTVMDAAQQAFLGRLAAIALEYPVVDLAMFPVDKRLGPDFDRGAVQFNLALVKCHNFVPMHFFDQPTDYARPCCEKLHQYGVNTWLPSRRGDSVRLKL